MDSKTQKSDIIQTKDKSPCAPSTIPSKCSVIINSLPYWLILIVFFLQIFSVVQTHSLVARLTIADTLLILIVHFHKVIALYSCFSKNSQVQQQKDEPSNFIQPFFTVVGWVAFEALLFVNLTHSLEAAFCAEPSSDISTQFLAINCLNILTKLVFLIFTTEDISLGGISGPKQLVLHVLAPTVALALSLMNYHYSSEDNYYMLQLDPILSIGLCILLSVIVVPLFIQQISHLLLHIPEGFDLEQFKKEIEQQFPNITCTHLHIFRQLPGDGFETFLDINFLPDTSKQYVAEKEGEDMYQAMEARMEKVLKGIHSILHKAGATRITIQPYYTNSTSSEGGRILNKINGMQCTTSEYSKENFCCNHKSHENSDGKV